MPYSFLFEDLNKEIASKEEKMIYNAAKRGAYGIVIEAPDVMTIQSIDSNKFETTQQVRLCQTEEKFEEAKKQIASCFTIKIPTGLYDIAKKNNFQEFKEKVVKQGEGVLNERM